MIQTDAGISLKSERSVIKHKCVGLLSPFPTFIKKLLRSSFYMHYDCALLGLT